MPRTKDAVKILEKVTRESSLRDTIAEDRFNLRVAQMIYHKRTVAGLTQAELARIIGTTQSVVARLEDADYTGHSLSMLHRIARALDGRLEVKIVGSTRRRARPSRVARRKTGTKG
jgi:transcriptional regulator with XRE-family HTH domain